jgi:hypothetical protein
MTWRGILDYCGALSNRQVPALPWRFALGAKVFYIPHGAPSNTQPWRVIGRSWSQMQGQEDAMQYTIQPYVLTGTWVSDRALVVFESQLAAWRA